MQDTPGASAGGQSEDAGGRSSGYGGSSFVVDGDGSEEEGGEEEGSDGARRAARPPRAGPPRNSERTGTPQLTSGTPPRPASGHDDVCRLCSGEGELLMCDGCPASYHLRCVGLRAAPEGDWFCPGCAQQRQREQARGPRFR